MADEADLAQESTDRWLAGALQSAASGAGRLQANGSCHYCGRAFEANEENAGTKLFCDADCHEDHETEARIRARQAGHRV